MSHKANDRIKQVLVQTVLKQMSVSEISDETSLIDLGVGLDSVATLELVVALEEEFQVSIDDGEITPEILESVNTIQAFVESKSQAF